jgi:hypothetical protein
MKWLVMCYSVHERKIASVDPFDTEKEAKEFLEKDAQSTFEEELSNATDSDKDGIYLDIGGDNETAELHSHGDEYIWTWDIIEVKM